MAQGSVAAFFCWMRRIGPGKIDRSISCAEFLGNLTEFDLILASANEKLIVVLVMHHILPTSMCVYYM